MSWLHHVWFVYFVPSLQGNGPEDLLAFLLVGGGVTWVGRWALREWRGHKAHVHAKLDALHMKMDAVHQHLGISSDVPNEVPGVPEHLQPKS